MCCSQFEGLTSVSPLDPPRTSFLMRIIEYRTHKTGPYHPSARLKSPTAGVHPILPHQEQRSPDEGLPRGLRHPISAALCTGQTLSDAEKSEQEAACTMIDGQLMGLCALRSVDGQRMTAAAPRHRYKFVFDAGCGQATRQVCST